LKILQTGWGEKILPITSEIEQLNPVMNSAGKPSGI
jgi:hypothetical protein